MIKLGQKVRDKVTGFEGIAIAKVEYLNGCVQFCVKPKAVDSKMLEGEYIDDGQLEVVDDGATIKDEPNGGPMPDTPTTYYGGYR